MSPGSTERSRRETFAMRESATRRVGVQLLKQLLLLTENGWVNKDWVTRVPAAAVILGVQVIATIIGSKASVAGPVSPW